MAQGGPIPEECIQGESMLLLGRPAPLHYNDPKTSLPAVGTGAPRGTHGGGPAGHCPRQTSLAGFRQDILPPATQAVASGPLSPPSPPGVSAAGGRWSPMSGVPGVCDGSPEVVTAGITDSTARPRTRQNGGPNVWVPQSRWRGLRAGPLWPYHPPGVPAAGRGGVPDGTHCRSLDIDLGGQPSRCPGLPRHMRSGTR